MKLNKKIEQSKITKAIFSIKVYFNIAVSQISFITGKLPELVSAGLLLAYFGIQVSKSATVLVVISSFTLLTLAGYILKKSGLYNTEQYTHAKIDPVQNEILTSLREIRGDIEWMKKELKSLK